MIQDLNGTVRLYTTPNTSDTSLATVLARLNETGEVVRLTDIPTDAELAAKADLVDGKVPASQLPSYVDDVIEVADFASLPATGEAGKLYVTLDTELIYRWTGTIYAEISPSTLQNLQSVTDNGSVTTNQINISDGVSPDNVLKLVNGDGDEQPRYELTPNNTQLGADYDVGDNTGYAIGGIYRIKEGVFYQHDFPSATGTIALTNESSKLLKVTTVDSASLTGTTGETVFSTALIPANSGTGILECISRFSKTGTNGSTTIKFYLNTTPDLTGSPVQIAVQTASATNITHRFSREFEIKTATIEGYGFATTSANDYATSTGAMGSTAWNPAVDQYIISVAALGNSADSLIEKSFTVAFKKTI